MRATQFFFNAINSANTPNARKTFLQTHTMHGPKKRQRLDETHRKSVTKELSVTFLGGNFMG